MYEGLPRPDLASQQLSHAFHSHTPIDSSQNKKITAALQGPHSARELTLNTSLQTRLKGLIRKGVPMILVPELLIKLWNIPAANETYATIRTRQEEMETYAAAVCPTFTLASELPDAVNALLSEKGVEALKRVLWAVNEAYPNVRYCPMLPCVAALSLLFLSESEAYLLVSALITHSEPLTPNPHLHWHFLFSQTQYQRFYRTVSLFLRSKEPKLLYAWERNGVDAAAVVEELIGGCYLNTLHWNTLSRLHCCYLSEGVRVFIRFTLGVFKKLKVELQDLTSTKDVLAVISQALSNPIIAGAAFHAGTSSHLPNLFPQWLASLPLPDSLPLQVSPSPLHSLIKSTIMEQRDFQRIWQEIPPHFQLMSPTLVYCSETDGIHLPTLLRKSLENGKSPGIFLLGKSLDSWKFGVFVDSWLRITQEYVGGYESCFFIVHPKQSFSHINTENEYVLHASEHDITVGAGPHGPALSLDSSLVHGYSAVSSTFANEVISTGSFVLQALELFALTV